MDPAPRKLKRGLLLLALLALASGALFWLGAGYPRSGAALRLPASSNLQMLTEADYPAQIENMGSGDRIWAIRRSASDSQLEPAIAHALQFALDAPEVVAAYFNGSSGRQKESVMFPLFAPDGASGPALVAYAPLENGDALDSRGRPLRWSVPANILGAYNVPRPMPFQLPPRKINPDFARALAKLAPARKASDYRSLVESFARRYGLNTNLVMAIIHSESNFVPSLVSSKSAMGLMQLLPSTASGEVHRFLYGAPGRISFAELSVPEINIRYGTAYLHILNNRYFAGVRNRQVREACVIAAYNMGPNGFLKLYGSKPELAWANINSMSPDEFLEDLQRRLPMRETRFYVEKVRRMKEHYSAIQ